MPEISGLNCFSWASRVNLAYVVRRRTVNRRPAIKQNFIFFFFSLFIPTGPNYQRVRVCVRFAYANEMTEWKESFAPATKVKSEVWREQRNWMKSVSVSGWDLSICATLRHNICFGHAKMVIPADRWNDSTSFFCIDFFACGTAHRVWIIDCDVNNLMSPFALCNVPPFAGNELTTPRKVNNTRKTNQLALGKWIRSHECHLVR